MPTGKKDKTISALETIHAALKTLNPQERQRVLASVHALLEISPQPKNDKGIEAGAPMTSDGPSSTVGTPALPVRKLAIRELIEDKKPNSHPEMLTLFAYFREKHENKPSFARGDLELYYKASREIPPANFDRDFVKAVKKGWIHEDGDSSFITSKGIEAVESGFTGAGDKHKASAKAHRTKTAKKRA
jgi:hypothetical protein